MNSKIKDEMEQKRKSIDMMKLLDSQTRFRILINLYINELGLAELSERLGKSKSTISHHLNIMKTALIIREREIDSRGSIPKKIFSVSPEFLTNAILNSKNLQFIEDQLSDEEFREGVKSDLKLDTHAFGMLRKFLQMMINKYQDLNSKLDLLSRESITDYIKNKRYKTFILPLDEQDYKLFKKRYDDLELEFLEKYNQKDKNQDPAKPYLACHLLIPFDKLVIDERSKLVF